jgi:hypothetical protein
MGIFNKKVYPSNTRAVSGLATVPDLQSRELVGALGLMTNTFSPGSQSTYGMYSGVPGDGVNRMTGRTSPLQFWAGAGAAVSPVSDPGKYSLGAQAGASGIALPNTSVAPDPSGISSAALMSSFQMNAGMS